MAVVTIVGSGGTTIPVTVNGAQAISLATNYQSVVNTAAANGTLGVVTAGSGGMPIAPGSAVNELVASGGGSFTYPSGFDHFTASSNDQLIINASGATSSSINTLVGTGGTVYIAGSADGTFIAGGGANFFVGGNSTGNYVVAAGDGNNTIQLGSGNSMVDSDGTDRVYAGTGTDTVNVAGSSSTVYGSSGALSVVDTGTSTNVMGGTGSTSIIGGASGSYTLMGPSTVIGGTSDTISAASSATVFGGSNALVNGTGASSSLLFIGTAGNATVNSGAGAATVFGSNRSNVTYTGHGTLVAGSGNETLNGSGDTQGFAGFVSNAGTTSGNEILGGAGADTLVAGMGTQTLGGGSGAANLFVIAQNGTNGNANITISDFGSSAGNLVGLFGYGANEVSKALSTATVSGGSTTITLGDNSKVTFTNVASLNSSQFFGYN